MRPVQVIQPNATNHVGYEEESEYGNFISRVLTIQSPKVVLCNDSDPPTKDHASKTHTASTLFDRKIDILLLPVQVFLQSI